MGSAYVEYHAFSSGNKLATAVGDMPSHSVAMRPMEKMILLKQALVLLLIKLALRQE